MNTEIINPKSTLFTISNFSLYIIYANVALYALCYHLQRPVEPFLVEKLLSGKDENSMAEYAKLQSVVFFIQTVGSLLVGRMLDRFGSKSGFIITFLASGASYAILASSTSMFQLYLSKIPTIFQAGFLCAQVAISQSTADGPQRVVGLSRLTLAYMIGTIIGPSMGGWLTTGGDYFLGAKVAVIGSIVSIILTLFMPNSNAVVASNDEKKNDDSNNAIEMKSNEETFLQILQAVWSLLLAKVVTGVANSMRETVFPLILKNIYLLDPSEVGYSLSLLSMCNALSTLFLVGLVISWANNRLLAVASLCLTCITGLFFLMATIETSMVTIIFTATTNRYFLFMAVTIIMSVLQFLLATTLTGESTARVGPRSKGTLLGLEHAIFALARIGSPQVAVYLLQWGGLVTVCGACGLTFAVVTLPWVSYYATSEDPESLSKPSERKEK